MIDDMTIPYLSNELEDAGWVGLAAAGLLAPFFIGAPGALSTTDTGFVWTKALGGGWAGESFSLGVGRLQINSGAVTATVGVNWYNGVPDVGMLFTLMDGASITLDIDEEYAYLAPRTTLPGDIYGYNAAGKSTLSIPLPATALEFSFRMGVSGGIASAIRTHGAVATIDEIAGGVFRWSPDPNKVIVIPKLFDVALMVSDFFLDFSDGAAVGTFLKQFPEVYNPNWKGFGATNVGLIIPTEDDAFINVGAEGFIYDMEGGFSGKCEAAWAGVSGDVRGLNMSIDLRQNEVVRGEIGLVVDLNGSTDNVTKNVTQTPPAGSTTDQQNAATATNDGLAEPDAATAVNNLLTDGLVHFKGIIVSDHFTPPPVIDANCPQAATPPDTYVFGLDLRMENILVTPPGESTPVPVTTLEGISARVGAWLLGGAIYGPPLLATGILEGSGTKIGIASALYALILGDMAEYKFTDPKWDVIPIIDRLSFDKMGMRYFHVSRFDPTDCRIVQEQYLDLYSDFSLRCKKFGTARDANKDKVGSGLGDLIEAIASLYSTSGDMYANLFGWDINQVRLVGALELAFTNNVIRFKFGETGVEYMPNVDPAIRRLLDLQAPKIIAKDMPELTLAPENATDGTGKPIVSVEFVDNEVEGEQKYGIAISLKGIGGSSLSVSGAAAGVVIYFTPEFDVVVMPQMAKQPDFQFVIPPTVLAKGVIDLEKPLPGFGGEQNRIAVDLGVVNSKVEPGAKLDKEALTKLHELKNYKYQLGGEVAWGIAADGPQGQSYRFLFAEAHFEGKSPLFTIGPVGIFGLGGLFGRNIEPGITGNRTAMGLANWIQGSGNNAFDNVKNWPAVPNDNTWHPARDWTNDRDLWAIGLFVKAGSADDGGKKFMVDGLIFLTLPEFRLAIAGNAVIKPVNAKLAVIIVFDVPSKSFLVKGVITYKVDEATGNIIKMKTHFEIGTTQVPTSHQWMYFGHYRDVQGGPAGSELFSLFNTKGYYVVDSNRLEEFGIVPSMTVKRPTIPGPAIGMGMLFQLGPKTYGPGWLNIQIYGGFGFNLAFGFDPMLVYGDIYALGYLKLKVAFFKAKLELAARLYGLATLNSYRFAGEFMIRLNLPWPLDDIEESVDFFIEDGGPTLEKPHPVVTAAGLHRLESRSQELTGVTNAEELVELPIDALIALQFNKPLLAINDAPPANSTKLTVNEVLTVDGDGNASPPDLNQLQEVLTAEFVDTTYQVTYTYTLDQVTVRYGDPQPNSQELPTSWTRTAQMAAVWQVPALYDEDGAPNPDAELHHALYLNGFLPTELQFSSDFLEQFENTFCAQYLPPCGVPTWACLLPDIDNLDKQPSIDRSTNFYHTTFAKPHGDVTMRELVHYATNQGPVPRNLNRLDWNVAELMLPHSTKVTLTNADTVNLDLRFQTTANIDAMVTYVEAYTVDFIVRLRGVAESMRIRALLLPDSGKVCGLVVDSEFLQLEQSLLSATILEESCVTPGELLFHVELVAQQFGHLIQSVTIEGPVVQLTPLALSELGDPDLEGMLEEVWSELGHFDLALHQLCYRYARNEREYWSTSEIAGGPNGGDPDTLWDNQLLEPGKIYEIHYVINADGTSEILEREEENCPAISKNWTFDATTYATMPVFRFRTEAVPSQEVSRYIGFSYPARSPLHAFYPEHFAPLLALKDRGLIRRIFEKHYGYDALQPKLVDVNGQEVEVELTHIDLSSSAPDCVLEQLAENCLPEAEGWTGVQVDYWETPLATASAYSLQLEDSGQTPARPAHSIAFRTSRFASFTEHIDALHSTLADAQQIPVLDDATIAARLGTIIGQLISGEQFGMDGVIERFYRELLGINAGRLADLLGQPDEEFVAYLTSGSDPDEFDVWAIVLELTEPVIGREGVILEDQVAGMEHLAAMGILVTQVGNESRLLVHDRAAGRVLIFNSVDGINFSPIRSDTLLNLHYSPRASMDPALRAYVQQTWPHLSPAEQETKITETYTTVADMMATKPALVDRLNDIPLTLTIPRGLYLP